MILRTLLVIVFLAISNPITVIAIDSAEINRKVEDLNVQSLKSFGVSLNALLYLVESSPNSYLLLWHLEETGSINYIRELENKGYIKVEIVTGLPDGNEKNEKFLRIKAIDKGIELKRSIIALGQKNITTKATGPAKAGR